jgi:hypothetical protein
MNVKIFPSNDKRKKDYPFLLFYPQIKRMLTQQSVYILGLVNLFLAGIAVLCVVQAENHPEYFSLVYIAVSIFIFYMGTILIIIILQIIETYQEQHQQNQSSLERQIPIITKTQLKTVIDESVTIPTKPKIRLSRSQTLPLSLFSYTPHQPSSVSTLSSTLREFKNTSSGLIAASTRLALPPRYQHTYTTIHKNYQSFAFISNEHRYPS